MISRSLLCLLLVAVLCPPTQAGALEPQILERIKQEATERSEVMETVFQLSDVHGARLAGSPAYRRAADWSVAALKAAGIDDASLDVWGDFGRSWSAQKVAVHMVLPEAKTLLAQVMPWSGGTDGAIDAKLVYAPLWAANDTSNHGDMEVLAQRIEAYKKQYRGKLKGKIVLISEPVSITLTDYVISERFDEQGLAELSEPVSGGTTRKIDWITALPEDDEASERLLESVPLEIESDYWELELRINSRLHQFLREEQVAAVLMASSTGPGGTVSADTYASYHPEHATAPPTAIILAEQYNRILRLLDRGMPVTVSVDIDATLHAQNTPDFNVIASLPGGTKANEIVMLGAHLDSWMGGTGAADNAAGVAIVMEAMRILKELELPLKRTVRMALWGAEEQNYYGSRAYVKQNFADPITMTVKPDHKNLSAYFNLDNGGGKIRGIYLEENASARPLFEQWLSAFSDMGASAVSIRKSLYTDHQAYNGVGLPGFQFIQDPLEYENQIHHSNVDTLDHLVEADLMQASAVLAGIVYLAANSEEKVPRKTMPGPLPPRGPLPLILRD